MKRIMLAVLMLWAVPSLAQIGAMSFQATILDTSDSTYRNRRVVFGSGFTFANGATASRPDTLKTSGGGGGGTADGQDADSIKGKKINSAPSVDKKLLRYYATGDTLGWGDADSARAAGSAPYSGLTGVPSSFTPSAHGLTGSDHTVAGLTTGHFLKATGATSFGFAAHGLTYTDVGAAASAHNHTLSNITNPSDAESWYQLQPVDASYAPVLTAGYDLLSEYAQISFPHLNASALLYQDADKWVRSTSLTTKRVLFVDALTRPVGDPDLVFDGNDLGVVETDPQNEVHVLGGILAAGTAASTLTNEALSNGEIAAQGTTSGFTFFNRTGPVTNLSSTTAGDRWQWYGTGGEARLYTGTTGDVLDVEADGDVEFKQGVWSSNATDGIGYTTGSGGTVSQGTSKGTGVTLNKITGAITTHNATLNAGAEVTFTVTNSAVAATDAVIAHRVSGGTAGSYYVGVDAVAAGSFTIIISNLSGSNLGEALVIRFAIIKASSS